MLRYFDPSLKLGVILRVASYFTQESVIVL
jgi:hypothetical protein